MGFDGSESIAYAGLRRRKGRWIMALYFALHTLKKTPQELHDFWTEESAVELARAMAAGATPAKCIKTWNPAAYGRTDYMFCLWEADKPEDVEATLGPLLEYLTADVMQVDETDWEQVAKAAG